MNETLSRPRFNQMETPEKQALMEKLAARYDMTFLGLHTFDRWGQSCTTGVFEKDGREFVFVPGDRVTLGWERFAIGLNQESREELEYLFREWEMEGDPEEMLGEGMAPVRQAAIPPMLVGRELEEIGWEPVALDDPRLCPDWLEELRRFAATGENSLTLVGCARFERMAIAGRRASTMRQTIPTSANGSMTRAFPCPQQMSGLTCAEAGAAPSSPGETGWTTPCASTGSRTRRTRTDPMTWKSPISSDCPSPTTPINGKWCRRTGSPPAAATAAAISAAGWGPSWVSSPAPPTTGRKSRRTMNWTATTTFTAPSSGWR